MSKNPPTDEPVEASPGPSPTDGGPKRHSLIGRLRNSFLAGLLVTAPIGITIYIVWIIVNFVDSRVTPLIPVKYNPETSLPINIPGLGLVIVFVTITLIGALMTGFLGRYILSAGERILARMPVVRSIYGALKQIFEAVLTHSSTAFRKVVLIEYPRRGIWVLGFITGETKGEIQNLTKETVINVFLPTTPNPTSGFLLFVPAEDVHELTMTVEEGIKMVVSGGIVTPPDRRPLNQQKTPQLASAEVLPDQ
ncbi:MAG: DUF502 domain-containing protein [Alphaproteobacteria bacterium]|nr:DUF502 domain-containing protein [Alphaproteobacteria bacterium]